MRIAAISVIMLFALFISGCSKEPEAIKYGKDVCEHCKMTIVDRKWGAELITQKGKIYKFDVIECMISYLKEHQDIESELHSAWTIDFLDNSKFINAEKAYYLRSAAFHSPMGLNAVALTDPSKAKELKLEDLPEPYGYISLKKLVYKEFGYGE